MTTKHRLSALAATFGLALLGQDGLAQTGGEGAAVAAPDATCEHRPFSILVSVKNVKDARGTITLDLHNDDPEKFLKSGAKLARLRVPAVAGELKICVPVEAAGVYAIALYQDRDGNQKLDKTWIGLPAEPFGISRDAPLRMSPPKLKDAVFEVSGPLTPVTVTLRK